MVRKVLIPVLCLFLLAVPLIAQAQTTPQPVMDALADLSSRIGTPLTIDKLGSWSWEQSVYSDTSLGCPLPGQSYTQVQTSGYRVSLTYRGITYDYRVSADRKILFLCSPNNAPNSSTSTLAPVPTTAPQQQNVVVGQIVCTGGMPARLWIGGQGQSIATGSVNIRQQPTQSSAVAGLLLPNGQFSVTDGPRCDGIKTWWKINYTGSGGIAVNGWIMEGDATSNDYWLQPIGTPPTGGAVVVAPPVTTGGGSIFKASSTVTSAGTNLFPIPDLAAAQIPIVGGADVIVISNDRSIARYSGDAMTSGLNIPSGGREYQLIGAGVTPTNLIRLATVEYEGPAYQSVVLRLWEVSNTVPATAAEKYAFRLPMGFLNGIVFSPDASLVAISSGATITGTSVPNAVWLWETASGTQRAPLMLTSPAGGLAFSPDGKTLAVSCVDGTVHLWDIASQTDMKTLPGAAISGDIVAPAIAYSPTGTQMAVGRSAGSVDLFALPAGTLQTTIQAAVNNPVRYLAYSSDGSLLATGGATLHDFAGMEHFVVLWNTSTGAAVSSKVNLDQPLNAVFFSKDGTRLVAVGVKNWWAWQAQ